jgi:hypothetical protein
MEEVNKIDELLSDNKWTKPDRETKQSLMPMSNNDSKKSQPHHLDGFVSQMNNYTPQSEDGSQYPEHGQTGYEDESQYENIYHAMCEHVIKLVGLDEFKRRIIPKRLISPEQTPLWSVIKAGITTPQLLSNVLSVRATNWWRTHKHDVFDILKGYSMSASAVAGTIRVHDTDSVRKLLRKRA